MSPSSKRGGGGGNAVEEEEEQQQAQPGVVDLSISPLDYDFQALRRQQSASSPLLLASPSHGNNNNNNTMMTTTNMTMMMRITERILTEYVAACRFYGCGNRINAGVLTTIRFSLPALRVSAG